MILEVFSNLNDCMILFYEISLRSTHHTGCCIEGHGLARTIGDGRMVGLDPVGLFQP